MTVKFSATLGSQLASKPTKLDWANMLKSVLGTTRRLRCYHDPAGGADPAVSGTEFLNLASTGDFTVTSGNITGLGKLSGATVNLAKDLSTGTAALRIEGNGQWLQASLGLPNSGADFILPANPTGATNVGVAFVSGAGTKAPRLLASGTGPIAPPIKDTTPTIVELMDWTDPANPVVVGIFRFLEANRQDDWVFQNAEMAAEIGDVAIYQIDDSIKWTSPIVPRRFELGGLLLIASNYNSQDGATQLEQMLLSFKPYQRWASYPLSDTFIKAHRPVLAPGWPPTFGPCDNGDVADRTIPPPFKINIYTATGYKNGAADRTPLYTHEWKAFNDKPALPINSPQLSEVQTDTEPAIPRFNCGMMLPWQNIRTRLSSKASKYFPGVDSISYDHSVFGTKAGPSSNAYHPLAAYAYGQADSMAHWYVLPPYPLKNDQALDNAYLTAYESRPRDPSMFNNRDHYPWYRAMGYKYQPGAVGGHDWITGKGGVRFDRAVAPAVLAIYASNQTWLRPEGNVPIRDMVEEWGLNYFNHSNHWIRNVKTFDSLPKADILAGRLAFLGSYYGNDGQMLLSSGAARLIDIVGIPNGKGRWEDNNDPDGFMYYSGWQRDALHSYCNAAWWAVMLNSPMHALAARHDFETEWMSSLGGAAATADPIGYYGTRVHAWRMLAYVMAWKVATDHPLGYSKEEVEVRLQVELELIYDKIYKPAFIDIAQTMDAVAIRNLGSLTVTNGDDIGTPGGSLGLYMVHALVLMRQFGMFAAMRARSFKCRDVLDMMIRNLDKFCIDYVMDTDMRDCYYPTVITGKTAGQYTPADVPADWGAQKALMDSFQPPLGAGVSRGESANYPTSRRYRGFLLAYDGRAEEPTGCPHLYMQYLKARRDYFPDYPAPRLTDAIAKVQAGYDQYLVKRAAGLAYTMGYLYPGHAALLPPTEVGPK